ncbi:aspartate/glutamate racemase family protein [Cupriavidus necator]|uniref:Arylmalonate decarboxylase n=1 Tax=Cupriavidus necator TaxID=106590 RepID=A0A367PBR9_CUPNE|nr:aspartate/glutamate racemase family protein [Cupriavidus necator]QQX86051.1 aspartate/glutamate racemase family protein [Cupriavidus necator]RCJ04535.1 arylmalonate decarboxylase [Cupriavidus necator]
MSLGFGSKARIGHLYPSGGQCDFEVQMMAPEGVQFLATRMPFSRTSLESDHAVVADIESHAALLADAAVDLIAMNCTAASMAVGADVINERIWHASGIPSVTTTDAVMAALHAVGANRIALLTPYPQEVMAMEIDFLRRHDIQVLNELAYPCSTPVEQGRLPPEHWLDLAGRLDLRDVDTLLISCAGIQVGAVIDEIERMGKPVITSNQALLWHCLKTLALRDRPAGYGALLRGEFG